MKQISSQLPPDILTFFCLYMFSFFQKYAGISFLTAPLFSAIVALLEPDRSFQNIDQPYAFEKCQCKDFKALQLWNMFGRA